MAFDLLLLSNSTMPGQRFMEYAQDALIEFLGGRRTVHFAPYAIADHDRYIETTRAALAPLGVTVIALHHTADPRAAVDQAEVLFVGGGNSFRLLQTVQRLGLLDVVRRRVASGELRYMGASAGSNLACPSIRTTNDMPIVQPASFDALGLIPFQINPHYQDPDPTSTHMGETREQRLVEFLEENDAAVLGLREGAWLRRSGESLRLGGKTGARLFQRGAEPREFAEGADLSWLLGLRPRFDQKA